MKKLAVKVIGTLSAAVLVGVLAFAQSGGDLFKQKCASCHGADGTGVMAKKMGSRDLNSADVQNMSDKELAEIITVGKNKMPAYKGKLTDTQIDEVVKHIRTLKK